ncbi:type III pantothenate kinase [Novisyntrophococcus fermenticellae]|uniref:type III pantothenate kinase n=1 Tax=Novisyntrophococcus fermenticellae TaxID=2068655 RepID=UPI001E36AE3E|nr:type III pantothenate kinase [Novisyntrophococcus fermenticellae]
MLLVMDIGNTNVVVGCIEGEKVFFIERMSTDRKKTELEYAISIKNVLEIYGIRGRDVEGAIISSVVPQITEVVRSATEKLICKPPKVVGPGLKTGLNIMMDQPAQLGSDLVVDAVAAMAEHPVPLIIIDMGTATTVSVVDSKKRYIGGMIMPGIRTATDSLVSNAAQLQQISFEPPKKLIGSNTIDCMKSGALYGNAAALDGLIDRIQEELGESCTTVATGGLAESVVPLCKKKIVVDNNLLMKGLQIIYDKNR